MMRHCQPFVIRLTLYLLVALMYTGNVLRMMELVDTPISDPIWEEMKTCKTIQDNLKTEKCDYQKVLMSKYHHKQCVEKDADQIFKPLMSSDDLQTAVCESFNRVAV